MPTRAPHQRLAELAWLVDHWEETDEAADLSVHSEYSWARGGNFLTRNVTVKRAGETTLESWQIIGWDPVEERIRSWTFDGEGGFAEGWWTREGERWLLRETGVTPDGSRTVRRIPSAKSAPIGSRGNQTIGRSTGSPNQASVGSKSTG
jgi:hypothetical protein